MKLPTLVTVSILFCAVVLLCIAQPRAFFAMTSWINENTIAAVSVAVVAIYGARRVHRGRRRRSN